MAEVKGVLVTPVKNPTIPASTRRLVLVADNSSQPANNEPTLAPAVNDGAKIPPAAPVVNEMIGPTILSSGVIHDMCLSSVNNIDCINPLPEPSTALSKTIASVTMISAQTIT